MKNMIFQQLVLLGFCFQLPLCITGKPTRIHPETKLWEGELTQWIIRILEPLDPLTIEEISVPVSTETAQINLEGRNVEFRGFSQLSVTVFNPPTPLFSKQLKFQAVIDSVRVETSDYSISGVWNGDSISLDGSMWLQLDSLEYEIVFDTDGWSSDSTMSFCVEHGTFHIDLSVNSLITGYFEGSSHINDHIQLFGQFLIQEMENYFNANGEIFETKLNELFCSME